MCYTQVRCITCGSENEKRMGTRINNVPRYQCSNDKCETKAFMLEYHEPGIKEKVVEMAINGSGIRDTGRVLGINKKTVMSTLKKRKWTSSS